MIRKLLASIVASTCLLAGNALALPFQANPQSFTSYLNQIKWNDGKRRVFANLSSCNRSGLGSYTDGYFCNIGYVTINDPIRGRIFCELQKSTSKFGVVSYFTGAGTSIEHGSAYPCRKA
jgi:hypothetical protein